MKFSEFSFTIINLFWSNWVLSLQRRPTPEEDKVSDLFLNFFFLHSALKVLSKPIDTFTVNSYNHCLIYTVWYNVIFLLFLELIHISFCFYLESSKFGCKLVVICFALSPCFNHGLKQVSFFTSQRTSRSYRPHYFHLVVLDMYFLSY